jgi:uroporphyrin-III C-methyltransferase
VDNKTQVYLVGAGPGDTGLITVKGLRCLQQADVVLYDKLANPQFLEEAPDGAELIYVGKVKGHHLLPQEQINELLEEKAQPGLVVVRLKGGDPYIFGRGGEEAQHLEQAGIPFEVVPGITAGFAAAAYAGIPVTHRDCTTSVSLITGHAKPGNNGQSEINWKALASGNGTLVFYMGLGNIATICQELISNGRAACTPVAIISCATTEQQQTFTTTLGEAPQQAEQNKIPTPSVIVVGEVVALRDQLRWFDSEPRLEQGSPLSQAQGRSCKQNEQLAEVGVDQASSLAVEMNPPKSLPVLLKDPRILLLGGGKVAYRKAKVLLDNHVDFKVISESFHPSFEALEGRTSLTTKPVQSVDLTPFNIIVDATGNQMITDLVHAEKQKRFVLSNIVDDPDQSDFYFSSLLNYGLLKIAVSTEGASPTVGKIVRDKIKAVIPEGINDLLQDKAAERKAGFIDTDLASEQSFAAFAQLSMICCGSGGADLLSQRACRCLLQMDIVLYDRLVPGGVLDLVSDHAQMVLLDEPCTHDSIKQDSINRMVADYLRKGMRVARIQSIEKDGFSQLLEEVESLSQLGIEVVIIPISNSGS